MKSENLFSIFHLLLLIFSLTASAQQSDNYRSRLRDRTVKIDETNLPIVFIDVDRRMILRDSYILGRMKILHNGDGEMNYADTVRYPRQHIDYEGYIALKYRGNSSFDQSDKKPMAFRTLASDVLPDDGGAKQKVELLGMAKDNKWAFIAPWCDQTMLRDVLSFELARPWMAWVPSARLCEVILDGTYYGVYVLCERPSKGKHRLDLDDPTVGDDGRVAGGDWHVSIDHGYNPYYASQHRPWQSLDGSRVAWNYIIKYEYKDPDDDELWEMSPGVRSALQADIDRMENAFLAPDWSDPDKGYRREIDMESFIDYMLATELSMNIDGYRLSTHLYRHSTDKDDGRWRLTLWDFNIAWGNANYYDGERTDRWQYMLNVNFTWDDCPVPFYWYRLLQDTAYVSAMKLRWQQYREANHSTPRLLATVDSLAQLISSGGAAERNERAWGIFTRNSIWPVPYYASDFDDAVEHLRQWIRARLSFLDQHLLPPRVIETEPILIADGWNNDIVAESMTADAHTTTAIDGSERVFYSAMLRGSGGLPSGGQITSAQENVHFCLQPYDQPGSLTLKSAGATGTLTFSQPVVTPEIFVLGTSGNGDASLRVDLTYADGQQEHAGTFVLPDWSRRELQGDEAVVALGNVRRDNNSFSSDNHYCLYQFSVEADSARPVTAVTFLSTNFAYASVMALACIVDENTQSVRHSLATDHRDTRTYDLQGRLVGNSQRHHIYIKQGRKILK